MNIDKQDERLLHEILSKYKQGLISGLIQGNNVTFTSTGCRNKVISSTGGGAGGGIDLNGLTGAVTLSAGNNITLNESGNDIEITANFTQEGKYMISGGITWSGTGLTYDVSFLNYFFNGNKTANPTQVTLAASDPTNNRFDAIVVDEAGTVTTITGTPSANPEVPAIPEDQLQVTIILVAAGSTTPTIASEEIYMDDPTTNWTFSTYTTATPTGSINFAGTSSPKQGTECIEASTDARLGARFVRDTSFDAFQYTMLQVWVRFTGTAVATNKSLNVRFENSAGTLVANTVNLFNYGLQRGVLNTWQLVVVPITAFGALPATVKGLKMIMAGGTVGVVRQWDIDFMILTNGSVPFANVPTIAFFKNGTGIASQSGLNLIEGTGVTIDAVNNPTNNRVDYTINASGGDFIPLSGTEIGKPVTGDILNVSSYKISDGANVLVDIKNDGGDGNVVVISADGLSQSNITSGGVTAIEGLFNKLQVTGTPTPSTSVGISSLNDYSSVIDDLDYTQKIYVDNIAGKIIDLGTITFEDVNAAPADGTISFTGIITTPLPAGWYVETILVDKHIFDADITSITFKAGGDDNINIDNTNSKVAFSGLIKNDQKDTVPTLDFTFDTVNPQNLTIGFITIKALIKKFPN